MEEIYTLKGEEGKMDEREEKTEKKDVLADNSPSPLHYSMH